MSQQFSEKAGKLLDRINSISFQQKKQKLNQTAVTSLSRTQFVKTSFARNQNINIVSPQTQAVLQLVKIQQDLIESEQENCRKFKNLNEEIRKLQIYIKEQTQTRLKIHQTFIHSIVKAQKNMQNSVSNVRKLYSERQKKLQLKIEQVLKQEKKKILQQIQSNVTLQQNLSRLKNSITSLKQQLIIMKRSRIQLQDKITRQFNDQITDLKNVFSNTIRLRQERQLKVLDMLKTIYKKHMEAVRKQQMERQTNQKMFLTVIQQLIDRITQA